MSSIRVKNFGPIKDGLENKEYLHIDKVTLFIGNQATGKSSIAKLYSTLTWLEKSIFTEELTENDITQYNRFVKQHCAYQGIQNYFRENTEIDFIGEYYDFRYSNGKLKLQRRWMNFKGSKDKFVISTVNYLKPKIMYVPAERNFLSVVEQPDRIKYLPLPLYTFLDEFERSKLELKKSVDLPINGVSFEYQKQNKISYIKGNDFRLRLHEASSGIQSLLPLYLVSRNLAYSIENESSKEVKEISLEQEQKLRKEVEQIMKNQKLTEEVKNVLLERLASTYKNQCFINIVEEIEQNLFPTSQRDLLYELLNFNNLSVGNQLLLTTHSPYILNYLTIAIKAGQIKNGAHFDKKMEEKLNDIIPSKSSVSPSQVNIYEFSNDGNITKLPTYQSIPSDNNYLNQFLADTNELFDQLLEMEEILV